MYESFKFNQFVQWQTWDFKLKHETLKYLLWKTWLEMSSSKPKTWLEYPLTDLRTELVKPCSHFDWGDPNKTHEYHMEQRPIGICQRLNDFS